MKNTTLGFTIAALLATLAMTSADAARASNAIAKEEAVACTTCHDKPGSRLLTSKGKYYEQMRKLDGHDALVAAFGACTNCHVRRPGSPKLTREGRLLRDLGKDMAGLEKWILERHPAERQGESTGTLSDDSPIDSAGSAKPAGGP